jgi:hypothetical protein
LLCQIGWQSERVHVALDGRRSLCLFADYGFRLRHGRSLPLFRPCSLSSAAQAGGRKYRLAITNWSRHNAAAGTL